MFKSDGAVFRYSRKGELFLPAIAGVVTLLAYVASQKEVQLTWVSAIGHGIYYLVPIFWAAGFFAMGVIKLLKGKKSLIKKYYWKITGVAGFAGVTIASLLVPINVFAQAAPSGGSAKCSALGFLNALGRLTVSTFADLTTGTTGGGSSVDLPDRVCQIIMTFVWAVVIIAFWGLVQALIAMYQSPGGGYMQAGQSIIAPAVFLISVLLMLSMFGVV